MSTVEKGQKHQTAKRRFRVFLRLQVECVEKYQVIAKRQYVAEALDLNQCARGDGGKLFASCGVDRV